MPMDKISTPYFTTQPVISINPTISASNNKDLSTIDTTAMPSTGVMQFIKQFARVYSVQAGCAFIAN